MWSPFISTISSLKFSPSTSGLPPTVVLCLSWLRRSFANSNASSSTSCSSPRSSSSLVKSSGTVLMSSPTPSKPRRTSSLARSRLSFEPSSAHGPSPRLPPETRFLGLGLVRWAAMRHRPRRLRAQSHRRGHRDDSVRNEHRSVSHINDRTHPRRIPFHINGDLHNLLRQLHVEHLDQLLDQPLPLLPCQRHTSSTLLQTPSDQQWRTRHDTWNTNKTRRVEHKQDTTREQHEKCITSPL